MSVLTGQYPTLGSQELNIGLPSTYSVYGATGLPRLFERLPLEPGGRDAFRLCDVLQNPWLLMPKMLLVEDVTMGLCEPLRRLWEYCSLARRGGAADGSSKVELLGRLAAWKEQLDGVSCLCESASPGENASEFPLRAYCGGEGESSASALRRARSLVQEALILYRLLSLHLHADLRALGLLVSDLRISRETHAGISELQLPAREWARSADGKKAVSLAMLVLDEALERDKDYVLPLADTVLSASSVIMRAWVEHRNNGLCSCPPVMGAQATLPATPDFGDLVLSRENTVSSSISVCICNAKEWERMFRIARQHVSG